MKNCVLVSFVMKQLGLGFFSDFACDYLFSRAGSLEKTSIYNAHNYEETMKGRCF